MLPSINLMLSYIRPLSTCLTSIVYFDYFMASFNPVFFLLSYLNYMSRSSIILYFNSRWLSIKKAQRSKPPVSLLTLSKTFWFYCESHSTNKSWIAYKGCSDLIQDRISHGIHSTDFVHHCLLTLGRTSWGLILKFDVF